MWLLLKNSMQLWVLIILIGSGLYPISLWMIGQAFFPIQANGTIVTNASGQAVGSLLLGQSFHHDGYFHSRPSASSFSATNSFSSALAVSNPQLRQRALTSITTMSLPFLIPSDSVTTSASGLDPHITLDNALMQIDRVAMFRATENQQDLNEIRTAVIQLLKEKSFSPLGGLAGTQLVNVLEINLELDKRLPILANANPA